jgi:tRNA(Arg) A34 adenosine deaminase TadA
MGSVVGGVVGGAVGVGGVLAGLTGGGLTGSVRIVDHVHRTMRIALEAAQAAADAGETPVGAVVFDPASGEVIATGANQPIGSHDPTAHAEIVAIRAAARALGNYRLTGLSLAVTLEPCAMCAGAISHARLGRVVFGAEDPKGGAIWHGPRFFEQPTCHWRPAVEGGVLGEESATLLRGFFRARRGR